jgi:hypothetical protein
MSSNSINQLIFVMVKCYVLWTEFLNIIQTSFGFKELTELFIVIDLKQKLNIQEKQPAKILQYINSKLMFFPV